MLFLNATIRNNFFPDYLRLLHYSVQTMIIADPSPRSMGYTNHPFTLNKTISYKRQELVRMLQCGSHPDMIIQSLEEKRLPYSSGLHNGQHFLGSL